MRTANRVGALLLGLLLLAVGVLVVVEAVFAVAGRDPWLLPLDAWFTALTSTTPADTGFLAVSVGVGVLGLVIFAAQVRPWPPQLVAVNTARSDETWFMARRSVERRVAASADAVPGVRDARVRVRGRRRHWRLRVSGHGPDDRRDAVTDAVRHELGRLDAPADTSVSVRLRAGRVA
jgi:hypothetical protein